MKKRLLTLGALALTMVVNAQVITYVGEGAGVYVKTGALVYSGGGVKTVGNGVIDNSGNIMVVGDGTSVFETMNANNTTKKDGGNIILRMTNQTPDSWEYGQLYITGLTQANITGIVDKEYKDNVHGTYQQIALPFYDKDLSELSEELGKTFADKRWSQDEILVWNDTKVRFDLLKTTQTTNNAALGNRKASTAYFAIGSKGFKASDAIKTVKGVPYADKITETLQNAGAGINFGANGNAVNYHREKYNSYLQDSWDFSSSPWANNYGKNIYQFGNPYLTNLDLGQLGKVITNLQGVRVEPTGVTTVGRGSTYSTGAKYVTYASGVAVGDKNAIIRPMQTFVVKLNNTTSQTLNFDDLRRFAYMPRPENTQYSVTAFNSNAGGASLKTLSTFAQTLTSSSVKQLSVLALNAKGEEIGRTYLVAYKDGVSGQPKGVSTQVTAGHNIIGTFEEAKEGGLDENLKNSYWLYINEINENDFNGKEVPLRLYSKDIKSLKFEIHENGNAIAEKQEKLSSGESFYFNTGDKLVAIGNGNVVSLSSTDAEFGLYYGSPAQAKTETVEEKAVVAIQKPSASFVAYDNGIENYKLVFDPEWKSATVKVFDIAGKLVLSQSNVNTSNDFIIALQRGSKGTYIVNAVSETGKVFTQKIVK